MGTNDARMIALDARTGIPCADFGDRGEVKLDVGKPLSWPGEFQITSSPVVSRGVVIVGSSISDNVRVDAPSGAVRAFDARSGVAALELGPAGSRRHRRGRRQCLGADVVGRRARAGVPADIVAESGFLGRQASRQRRACQLGGRAADRDRRAGLVVPDHASRRLGL